MCCVCRATLLDAQAFGYLALLLNAPLLNVGLQNHLKACRNLVQFCQRILNAHFPLSPEGMQITILKEFTISQFFL